ncbi:MAG TPA: FUSC family membrane protein [Trinickia sp.]|nr:FUSC family membrane protein [Trinickia sp.]
MRYSKEIEKFLYSQYFFGGLRMAVGVSLPAILCLVVFHKADLGFTIATGALGACVVDMPGPLKYKHNEMLVCSVLGFVSALATGLATFNVFALWATVVALTFALSLTVVYGNRWPQISFATLFMMVMTLEEHFTPLQALTNAAWILAGGLWYTYWATLVSQWQAHRIEKQALAENVFACVDYLLARADFYDVDANLDDCYRNLVEKQTTAVEMQDAARAIVLRNLPKLRRGKLEAGRVTLFNLFINTVDLHELFVGAHTDYPLMRSTFGNADLMMFFRDLIRKAANDLEEIGLAVLQNRRPEARVNVKAEMRAIEYELEQMRKQGLAERNPEAYSAASASFRRIWSAVRLIDKMKKSVANPTPTVRTEMRIDHTLMRFLSGRRVPLPQIFSNLTMASPSFRHALRVTLAVAAGFWLGRLLPLTNAYWIVMTTLIIMKPGYSLTKQRNTQRIIGTTIGCAASLGLIWFVKMPVVLLLFMFASMVMSYSLLLFNYTASVVFTSSYVLLLFHLLAPGSLRIIGERAIDTVVGCALAIGASHLFPYWEYRLMGKLVSEMLAATRQYLESAWWWGNAAHAAAMASAAPGAAASDAAGADDRDLRYRLARKNVHIAFANLAQAFRRMMLEPKAQQRFVPELNDLLVQSHGLAAHITAAAPLLRSMAQHEPDGSQALQRALSSVRENITCAQKGEPPPADQVETTKQLTRELDAMVIDIERAGAQSAEFVGEIKLLALQCKQMLAASFLIRKDAGVIRLPEA